MREIDARAAMAMVAAGEAVVVDVREPGEFAGGHVPGAHNIPLGQLAGARLQPEPGKTLLLVCASGMRSARGCAALAPETGAMSIAGGVKAWRAAGGTLEGDGGKVIPLDRQVLVAAGALVLFGVLMSLFVHPRWILLPGFVGAGLIFAGLSGFCGMAMLLAKAPWNRRAARAP
jgi:rhodanese-related sulfurtransferase